MTAGWCAVSLTAATLLATWPGHLALDSDVEQSRTGRCAIASCTPPPVRGPGPPFTPTRQSQHRRQSSSCRPTQQRRLCRTRSCGVLRWVKSFERLQGNIEHSSVVVPVVDASPQRRCVGCLSDMSTKARAGSCCTNGIELPNTGRGVRDDPGPLWKALYPLAHPLDDAQETGWPNVIRRWLPLRTGGNPVVEKTYMSDHGAH